MTEFHRTKRDSRVVGFVVLSFVLVLSMIFMLIGFMDFDGEGIGFRMVFGFVGLAIFVLFLRGGWFLTGGGRVHVLSMTASEIEWGFMGDEKRLEVSEVSSFYWDDTDSFHFSIFRKDGKQVRLPYIETVVPHKSRGIFLAFLRNNYPENSVRGVFTKEVEKAAVNHS